MFIKICTNLHSAFRRGQSTSKRVGMVINSGMHAEIYQGN